MNGVKDSHFIFYWEPNSELSKEFVMLSHELKAWGITLVPVSTDDFPHFLKGRKDYLIALTHTLGRQELFNKFRNKFLDYVMISRKVQLFHLSSFSSIDKYKQVQSSGLYQHYALPLYFKKIAGRIASEYYTKEAVENKWPGGKRAKLPSDVQEQ